MSIYIIVTIVVLLSTLVCYAFISQSIEKKRVQKQRILMALKTKHRNFIHLINGFPPNFLSSELIGVVYRALIDTCEQLSKLEPSVSRYLDDMTLFTNQLNNLPKNNTAQKVRLDNPLQMKEIRQHLQELLRFIEQQQALKAINKVQFAAFVDQIKRSGLQMHVDTYIFSAKQAQQKGKFRLAVHFFTLAKKLLTAENSARTYDKQIAQVDTIINNLNLKIAEESDVQPTAEAAPTHEQASKEWDKFIQTEDTWKKKQIYD